MHICISTLTHYNGVLFNSKSVQFSHNFVIYSFILYTWNPCSLLHKLGNPIYPTFPQPHLHWENSEQGNDTNVHTKGLSFWWYLGTVPDSGWHLNTPRLMLIKVLCLSLGVWLLLSCFLGPVIPPRSYAR